MITNRTGKMTVCGSVLILYLAISAAAFDEPILVVEVCDVLRDLDIFDGKEVMVVGAASLDPDAKPAVFDFGCNLPKDRARFQPVISIIAKHDQAPWRPPKVPDPVINRLLARNPGCSVVVVRGRIERLNDPAYWVDPDGKRWPRKEGAPIEEPARIRSNGVTFELTSPPDSHGRE
jgi:hypothetical protein